MPDGYAGPTAGPGGDGLTEPVPEQLVRHWTGPEGTVEVRWPADEEMGRGIEGSVSGRLVDDTGADAPADVGLVEVAADPRRTPSGRVAVSMGIIGDLGVGACQTLQIAVADTDADRARRTASDLHARLFAPGGPFGGPVVALITEMISADEPPAVPACQAPEGVPHRDRVGGPVDLGTRPTPADALRAFIDSRTTTWEDPFGIEVPHALVADSGYTVMRLPDGSIAFVHEEGRGATVVHAAPVNGGWTVDHWEATGC